MQRDDGHRGPSPLGWTPREPALGCSPRDSWFVTGAGRGKSKHLQVSFSPSLGGEERSGGILPQEPPALAAAGRDRAPLPWQLGPAALDLT